MSAPDALSTRPVDPAGHRLSTNDKIDVCRGLFAILVVVAHSLEVTFSMLPEVPRSRGYLYSGLLVGSAGTGIYWVMGFFVISGYCIHLSVQRLCERGRFPLKSYLVARMTRILPLYYLALLFTVFIEWAVAAVRPMNWPNGMNLQVLACQTLLIQNLTQTYGSFASSWSITNEAFYYLFYGLLVAATVRGGRRPIAIGIAACLAIGVTMHVVYKLGFKSPAVASTALLFGLGINWFLGALVAEYRSVLAQDRRIQRIARIWPVLLLASIGLRCTYRVGIEFVLMSSGLAFTLMMIRFLGRDHELSSPSTAGGPAPRAKRAIAALGLASYPAYLFHGPILILTGSVLIRCGLATDWRWIWAALAGAGIAAGFVGGFLLEGPIMTWRAGFMRRPGSPRRSRLGVAAQARVAAAP